MSVHLALIVVHAFLATALLTVGALALLAPKVPTSWHPRLGNIYFLLLVATLPLGMLIGWQNHADRWSIFQMVTPPTFLMGLLGYVMAKSRPRRWLGQPWLIWHISGQSGSYIGVVTASAFQIFPRFAPHSAALTVALFVLPSVIGSVLIQRTIRYTRAVIAPLRQPRTPSILSARN
jgi:hypothetical protein